MSGVTERDCNTCEHHVQQQPCGSSVWNSVEARWIPCIEIKTLPRWSPIEEPK